MLARWYGASLATGQTIDDVQEWPARIEAVTGGEVQRRRRANGSIAARAVTGYLLPPDQPAAA